mgnify:CR=1 FL=1
MDNGFRFKLDRDYLSPIPTIELTLNPLLKQIQVGSDLIYFV